MKSKILYTFVVVFMFGICQSNGQSQKKQHLKHVKYKENVKAPLTKKESTMLKEVFADKFEAYILNRPQALKNYKHLLRNRIVIKKIPRLVANKEKYDLLSEVGLFNYYNQNLKFDKNFVVETFNPLKYKIQIYGKGSHIYRMDGTDYFIIIKSQHQ